MNEPTRWRYAVAGEDLEPVAIDREVIAAAIAAMRLKGSGTICRDLARTDSETWHAMCGSSGNPDRDTLAMPTTVIMALVAEGYVRVASAYSALMEPSREWVSRPVKVTTTDKGLERR